jgi:hypothetical protein
MFHPTNPLDSVVLGPYGAASGLLAATGTPTAGYVFVGDGTGLVPVASLSATIPLGARAYHSAAQSTPNNTIVVSELDSERWDTDAMHATGTTALTGTVTKSSGASTLAGVGTAFTTELVAGQLIEVPGGATEKKWVTSITNDASLNVHSNWANNASGQTASRLNSPRLTVVTAGKYLVTGHVEFPNNTTGNRFAFLRKNGAYIARHGQPTTGGSNTAALSIATVVDASAGDYFELAVLQSSGGSLNVNASTEYSPELAAIRIA